MKLIKKWNKAIALLLASALLTLSASAAAGGTGAAVYSNALTLADGFTYINEISYNADGQRVETYRTELSTESAVFPVVMACDTIYGGMTIEEMIAYAEAQGYNVVGAMNCDFFSGYKVPLGGVIEDGVYKSSTEDENLLIFTEDGAAVVTDAGVTLTLTNLGGGETTDADTGETTESANAGKTVSLTHLNKMRVDSGGLYLYTSAFSTISTYASSDGWAVRFHIDEGDVRIGGEVQLTVAELMPSVTSCEIGDEYIILTAADSSGYRGTLDSFAVGDQVTLTVTPENELLSEALWATGCGDILVSGGSVTDASAWDAELNKQAHPRTAVGIRADGTVVCYTIDGRSANYSNGALLEQLAADMAAMGCVTAVNMDGGGSTAFALRLPGETTASVLGQPSDGKSRSCGSYILFVTENESDGAAEHLYLEQDGLYILSGSALNLGYLASDAALLPAETPEDVSAAAETGSVENGVYTAGSAGTDTLTLSSEATGAAGSGTLHVVDSATISVTNAATGAAPNLSAASYGDTLRLSFSATRYGRSVYVDSALAEYTLTEGLGEIDTDGTIYITGLSTQDGTLTVTIGGQTFSYDVHVGSSFADIEGHWAREYIETLYLAGIVNGTGDGTFSPSLDIRRGDFVLMLWRAFGQPEAETEPDTAFADVPEDVYYAAAVAWAKSAGIVNGVRDTEFDPEGVLSREQAFTILYRAFFEAGIDAADTFDSALDAYTDRAALSDYAVSAAAALSAYGIVNGTDGALNPQSSITRAEMSKILCLALETAAAE